MSIVEYIKGNKFNFSGDVFTSPQNVIDRLEDYFEYLDNNKLKEAKLYGAEGEIAQLDKMRMPSAGGFARYLRVTTDAFARYKNMGGEWLTAFNFVEESIYAISLEGAAAGLLKEAIAIRKLGLADKIEESKTLRRVVILSSPDNGRAIEIEEADVEPE